MKKRIDFSIIVPFFNEVESLALLVSELQKLHQYHFEVIWVDDGSTDGSSDLIKKLTAKNNHLDSNSFIRHHKRIGKGQSLADGISASSSDNIIFLDADGQDDPSQIPSFLEKLAAGSDLVNGWRGNRQDGAEKTMPSNLANKLLWQNILHTKLHDVNCGFKAVKKSVFRSIPLYGDNYRFLPILAEKSGFKVDEILVNHRQRYGGISKYGASRIWSGLLDTMTTYFIIKFAERPLHFFGSLGLVLGSIGSIILIELSFEKLFFGELLYRRPILWGGILSIILGVQLFTTGVIAELMLWEKRRNNLNRN